MNIKFNSYVYNSGVENNISVLVGEVISDVIGLSIDSTEIVFVTESGKALKLHHDQSCCECVEIEDVEGCASDIIGGLVTLAEEVVGEEEDTEWGTGLYTFYKVETTKGGVWIRWYGSSNGYYSVSVDMLGGVVE